MIGKVREILQMMRGSQRFEKMREAEAMQYFSRDQLLDFQLSALRELVRHSYETVPYYKITLDRIGLHPEDIKSFHDYAALPVLRKEDLRNNLAALVSSSADVASRIENATGGSTGEPVRFFQDKAVFEAMHANFMLCLSFAGWTPSDMVVNIWGNPRDTMQSSLLSDLKQWLAGSLTLNAYRYNQQTMDEWFGVIKRYRRVFVYGYVSVLTDLAEHIVGKKYRVSNVRGVMTSAEKLHADQRDLLSRAFGCRVFDQYGSREVPCIASECEHGGMHLLTHSAYTEFLPDLESNRKRVIVTGLTNKTMPLLRYELGDYAFPLETVCSCGRTSPLIQMDIGRIYDFMVAADGSKIHGAYFVKIVKMLAGIASFQFFQNVPGKVELLIVWREDAEDGCRTLPHSLPAQVLADHGGSIELSIREVPEIPRTIGGKHRYIVCEVAR